LTYKYILGGPDGHTPVPVEDLIEWGQWLETHRQECVVRQEHIGPYFVSTIFIGLDMDTANFFGDTGRPPLLFETMSFVTTDNGRESLAQERCDTWAAAVAQHERIAEGTRAAANG
jgi:hypothetical protein